MKNNKGFTLIEVLVVIAVIAILASILLVGLGRVRTQGADARRIADLRTVANLLELFANKCGFYPGSATGGTCQDTGTVSYSALETQLEGSGVVGDITMPVDPGGFDYEYARDASGQGYVLKATLSDVNHSALQSGWDSGGSSVPLSCDPGAGEYCIRL